MNLYSESIQERERAAKEYKVFPIVPKELPPPWYGLLRNRELKAGKKWPKEILPHVSADVWPEHAFGTANASLILLMHRPGQSSRPGSPAPGSYIGPHIPVLGGIGHAHNVSWKKKYPDLTWKSIHEFIPSALGEFTLNSWTQIMITNLNSLPGKSGSVDKRANREAVQSGGRLDTIVNVCKPLLILACGKHVEHALDFWSNPRGVDVHCVSHPSIWHKPKGVPEGFVVREYIHDFFAANA